MSGEVTAGVLTFVATVLATGVGFWQWQRTRVREGRAEYRSARVEALGKVWNALSDLEIAQRRSISDRRAEHSPEHVRSVNILLMRESPFLRADEREWAVQLVAHVIEIDALLREEARKGAVDATWWDTTASVPPGTHLVLSEARELALVRERFGARLAAVVRGDHE